MASLSTAYNPVTPDTPGQTSSCQSFELPQSLAGENSRQPFNRLGRVHHDPCYVDVEATQSQEPGKYHLQNFYECGEQPHQTMDIALGQPLTQFRDGHGHVGQGGAMVDTHSSFRNGKGGAILTNMRCLQTLETRPHLTVPYMGRGMGDPCAELALKEGTSTSERKQCNTLAGVHLPNQYTPLVDCIGKEIQNPIHILPEDNQSDWTRGGYPSRQWIHNKGFDERCPSTEHAECPCHSNAQS